MSVAVTISFKILPQRPTALTRVMFASLRASMRLRSTACVHRTFLTQVAPCRRLTTSTRLAADQTLDDAKPKPKATTPLRRSARASLPIRVNPTPTQGTIQTVFTLATAERYVLSRIRKLHEEIDSRKIHEALWIPKWTSKSGKEGEIFVFPNGSFTCWGFGEEDAREFGKLLASVPGMEVAPLKEAETEELEFVTDPTENSRLQGDLIMLGKADPPNLDGSMPSSLPATLFPHETLLARYAFSQALGRSTALSALEVSLDNYLSSMALLPHALQQTGKPGMGRTALIKKLGELMKFRQALMLNKENFLDTPDFYWAEPQLEVFFNSLSDALEVKARTGSLNDKITYATEMQSILRQLLTESSGHRMELIIIYLIAVEVVIALIRDGGELWDMLTGSDEKAGTHSNLKPSM